MNKPMQAFRDRVMNNVQHENTRWKYRIMLARLFAKQDYKKRWMPLKEQDNVQ